MIGNSKFQFLNVDDLTLDVDNPRIRKWLEHYETPNEEGIKLALGAAGGEDSSEGGTTFESLKESIRASGGINSPIIVNNDNGTMIVIEGNTRLAIYLDFKDKGVPGEWDKIPALLYQNLDPEHIDAIRLQSHLVGPRPWDPYSKAKYLDHLYHVEHMTVDRIIAYCGGKQHDIKNYIDGYRDMEKYYRPILDSDQDFDTTRFSGFVELQRPMVKESIIQADCTLEDFARWIDNKKIDPLNTVRKLPKILADKKAKKVFFESGAREALKTLDSPKIENLLSELSLADFCRGLQRSIESLLYPEFSKMQNDLENETRLAVLDLKEAYMELVKKLEAD